MTNNDMNAKTASVSDTWRTMEPGVIVQAARIGEHVNDLLTEAMDLMRRARRNVDSIIEDSYIQCQTILDRLASESDRLVPILMWLRTVSKAVRS